MQNARAPGGATCASMRQEGRAQRTRVTDRQGARQDNRRSAVERCHEFPITITVFLSCSATDTDPSVCGVWRCVECGGKEEETDAVAQGNAGCAEGADELLRLGLG